MLALSSGEFILTILIQSAFIILATSEKKKFVSSSKPQILVWQESVRAPDNSRQPLKMLGRDWHREAGLCPLTADLGPGQGSQSVSVTEACSEECPLHLPGALCGRGIEWVCFCNSQPHSRNNPDATDGLRQDRQSYDE